MVRSEYKEEFKFAGSKCHSSQVGITMGSEYAKGLGEIAIIDWSLALLAEKSWNRAS
jgi:hypothetical protein